MEPILVSKHDAALALGISTRMLELLIGRGELRARRIGRRCLIAKDELERFAKGEPSDVHAA